jgi:hypothetical protein
MLEIEIKAGEKTFKWFLLFIIQTIKIPFERDRGYLYKKAGQDLR